MALAELRKQIRGLEANIPQHDDTVYAVVQAASQISKNTIGEHLDEFPVQLTGALCWGKDSFAPRDYLLELNEEHKASVNMALQNFKALNLAPNFVTCANFPLSNELHTLLRNVSKELHGGVGFAVLRGLNRNDYGDEDNIIVYAGLLSHIGNKRSTNAFGMSLEHIRDASLHPKPERLERDVELDPAKKHNAAEGGDQQFSSFWTVFNELRQTDPEALKELTNDIIWPPRPDEVDSLPIIEPMVLHAKGKVISQIIWAPFLGNPEYLISSLKRALGAINRSARANCITVNSQPGDIQLLNNFAVMHSRNGFRDSESERRHLMRMGVRDESAAWELPDFAEEKLAARFSIDPASQIMPIIDFDPWELTGTNQNHHG